MRSAFPALSETTSPKFLPGMYFRMVRNTDISMQLFKKGNNYPIMEKLRRRKMGVPLIMSLNDKVPE